MTKRQCITTMLTGELAPYQRIVKDCRWFVALDRAALETYQEMQLHFLAAIARRRLVLATVLLVDARLERRRQWKVLKAEEANVAQIGTARE